MRRAADEGQYQGRSAEGEEATVSSMSALSRSRGSDQGRRQSEVLHSRWQGHAPVPAEIILAQDTTGGPLASEVVYLDSNPTRYRFFITQDQADKVKRALANLIFDGIGIGLEIIPVPEYQVEAEPDRFADLVEVTLNGYNGNNE